MRLDAVVIDVPLPGASARAGVTVGGEPVVRRVLRTLFASLAMRDVWAIGDADALDRCNFGARIVAADPDHLAEVLETIAYGSIAEAILLVGPDLALLQPAHVQAFAEASSLAEADATFGIVDGVTMRLSYPGHLRPRLPWSGPPLHLASLAFIQGGFLASRADRVARILQTRDPSVWFGGGREATEERLSQLLHLRVSAIHTFPEAALGVDGVGDADFLNEVFAGRQATHGRGAYRLG